MYVACCFFMCDNSRGGKKENRYGEVGSEM